MIRVETLIISGAEFISAIAQQNWIAAFKGLLTVRKKQVELLTAEKDIQERDLDYIVAAN